MTTAAALHVIVGSYSLLPVFSLPFHSPVSLSRPLRSPEDYQLHLVLASGNGMTFERIHQVQKYLQFDSDDIQSL